MKLSFLYISLVVFSLFSEAQTFSSKVSIRNSKGTKVPFILKDEPVISISNDILNIAFVSTQNDLLELNNIDINLITDTLLNSTNFNIAWIKPSQTWLSSKIDKKSTIEIKCVKNLQGKPIIIYINTRIYNSSSYHIVRATVKGNIPAKSYQINN